VRRRGVYSTWLFWASPDSGAGARKVEKCERYGRRQIKNRSRAPPIPCFYILSLKSPFKAKNVVFRQLFFNFLVSEGSIPRSLLRISSFRRMRLGENSSSLRHKLRRHDAKHVHLRVFTQPRMPESSGSFVDTGYRINKACAGLDPVAGTGFAGVTMTFHTASNAGIQATTTPSLTTLLPVHTNFITTDALAPYRPRHPPWIPAFAGMTSMKAGMTGLQYLTHIHLIENRKYPGRLARDGLSCTDEPIHPLHNPHSRLLQS